MQRSLELCQAYDLSLPFNVCAVQSVLNNALAALGSTDKDAVSLASLKKLHVSDKAELDESLKALEDMLNKSEHRVHELKQNQDAIQELASRLDKTADALKKSEEHVQSHEDRISEQSN